MSEILGNEIAKIRKQRKMTQKKLCKGICSQGTISMIENGDILPGIEIISALAIRLNVPVTYFINLICSEDTHLKYDLIHKIENLMEQLNYQKVYDLSLIEIKDKENYSWFYYYFYWLHYLSGYYIKKYPLDTTLNKFKELYTAAPEAEINKDYLSDRILNSIATLYAIKKDFKSSIFYFNKINLALSDKYIMFDPIKIHFKIMYNKVKTLYDMQNYKEAITTANEGIEQSIQVENMSLLGNFYYYLGQCYERLEYPKEDISFMYQRALLYFQTLNRTQYISILKELKNEYLTLN